MPTYQIRGREGGELNCRSCNWRATSLFVSAENRRQALDLYRKGEGGLCGTCYGEALREATGGEVVTVEG
jgi:hypothetical protein